MMAQSLFVPYAVSGGGGGGSSQNIESLPGQWAVPGSVLVGDLVYATGAFSADKASSLSPVTMPCIGIVTAKPIATSATILYYGESPAVFAGLIPGSEYFVGLVAGTLVIKSGSPAAPGEVSQRVGVAISGNHLLFTPDPTTVNI
jgi:hypothetical protein